MKLAGEPDDQDDQANKQNNRKRINKFENSQYYIMPLVDGVDDDLSNLNLVEKTASSSSSSSPSSTSNNNSNNDDHNDCDQNEKKTNATNEMKQNRSGVEEDEHKNSSNTQQQQLNNDENNDLSNATQIQYYYTYTEKFVDITRPDSYTSRGFGFLLNCGTLAKSSDHHKSSTNNKNNNIYDTYAQIVVVEPDTLADRAGLKKGDLVVEINETNTSYLNNEQLRKIMRQRLQMNCIQLRVLSVQKHEKSKYK